MKENDISNTANNLMLLTWQHDLMQNGNAVINEKNSCVIELNAYGSSFFCIGRDNDTLRPFIGVHRNLLPWFGCIPYVYAAVDIKRSMVYLSTGGTKEQGLVLGIKIRPKRLSILWNKSNSDDKVCFLDLKMYFNIGKNGVSINDENIISLPFCAVEDGAGIVPVPIDYSVSSDIGGFNEENNNDEDGEW